MDEGSAFVSRDGGPASRNQRQAAGGMTRAYFFFALSNGDFALPALIAAHLRLAASAIAFRPASLNCRLGLGAFTPALAVELGVLFPDPAGRPRLGVEP